MSLPKADYVGPLSGARSARRSSVVIICIIYIGSREQSVVDCVSGCSSAVTGIDSRPEFLVL